MTASSRCCTLGTVIESGPSLTNSDKRLQPEGRPLRAAREQLGLSLRAIAARSHIDPGHLSKVERGEKCLSVNALHRLAVALELHELATHLQPYVSSKEKT